MSRLALVADPAFLTLRARLRERVEAAGAALTPETLRTLLDRPARSVLDSVFAKVGAHEGGVWLAVYPPAEAAADDPEGYLVPVLNTGPNAERFEREFRQPLRSGLISMVFKSGQSFCENQVYTHAGQDRTIDQATGQLTCAMIAVPLHFAHETRGILSCVQLKAASSTEPDPPGFGPASLDAVEAASRVLSCLLDHSLLGAVVGWHSS